MGKKEVEVDYLTLNSSRLPIFDFGFYVWNLGFLVIGQWAMAIESLTNAGRLGVSKGSFHTKKRKTRFGHQKEETEKGN